MEKEGKVKRRFFMVRNYFFQSAYFLFKICIFEKYFPILLLYNYLSFILERRILNHLFTIKEWKHLCSMCILWSRMIYIE